MYFILVNNKKLRSTNGNINFWNTYVEAYNVAVMCYGEDRINKSIKIIYETI